MLTASAESFTLRPPEKVWSRLGERRPAIEGAGAPVGLDRRRTKEDGLDRVEENAEIERDREVLDVVQVVPHLFGFFVEVVRVSVPDLGPTGDARANHGSEGVVGDVLDEELEVRNRVRPRSYQIHVAADHIEELGKLVEAEFPHPFSNPGDP